jgi:hypothetical protein
VNYFIILIKTELIYLIKNKLIMYKILYKYISLNSLICNIINNYKIIKKSFIDELLYKTVNLYNFLYYCKCYKWHKISNQNKNKINKKNNDWVIIERWYSL